MHAQPTGSDTFCRNASHLSLGGVFVPRLPLHSPEDAFPLFCKRCQFPGRPAFALIRRGVSPSAGWLCFLTFSHGQLYVVASRVGRADDLRFALPACSHGVTRNVVYTEGTSTSADAEGSATAAVDPGEGTSGPPVIAVSKRADPSSGLGTAPPIEGTSGLPLPPPAIFGTAGPSSGSSTSADACVSAAAAVDPGEGTSGPPVIDVLRRTGPSSGLGTAPPIEGTSGLPLPPPAIFGTAGPSSGSSTSADACVSAAAAVDPGEGTSGPPVLAVSRRADPSSGLGTAPPIEGTSGLPLPPPAIFGTAGPSSGSSTSADACVSAAAAVDPGEGTSGPPVLAVSRRADPSSGLGTAPPIEGTSGLPLPPPAIFGTAGPSSGSSTSADACVSAAAAVDPGEGTSGPPVLAVSRRADPSSGLGTAPPIEGTSGLPLPPPAIFGTAGPSSGSSTSADACVSAAAAVDPGEGTSGPPVIDVSRRTGPSSGLGTAPPIEGTSGLPLPPPAIFGTAGPSSGSSTSADACVSAAAAVDPGEGTSGPPVIDVSRRTGPSSGLGTAPPIEGTSGLPLPPPAIFGTAGPSSGSSTSADACVSAAAAVDPGEGTSGPPVLAVSRRADPSSGLGTAPPIEGTSGLPLPPPAIFGTAGPSSGSSTSADACVSAAAAVDPGEGTSGPPVLAVSRRADPSSGLGTAPPIEGTSGLPLPPPAIFGTAGPSSRLAEDAARHAVARDRETTPERQQRLAEDAARHAVARDRETTPERQQRIEQQAARQAAARDRETTPERQQRIEQQAARQAAARDRETTPERQQRLAEDAARHAADRQREDRAAFLAADAERHRLQREELRRRAPHKLALIYSREAYVAPPRLQLGQMEVVCAHCGALRWRQESPGACCHSGKVAPPFHPPPPEVLCQLFSPESPHHRHFTQHLRAFNSAFQLASMGCQQVRQPGWNPVFTVHGTVCHRIGSLLPAEGAQPEYLQIYFYNRELEARMDLYENLHPEVLQQLQEMLHDNNIYVRGLRSALELVRREDQPLRIVLSAQRRPATEHERRFNLPETGEVAVLMPEEPHGVRDIVLHHRDGGVERINEYHRSYDPLHYVLLHPHGTDGWSLEMKHAMNITATEYYAFHLRYREPAVVDEIATFQQGRYLSAMEAAWRLLQYPIHEHLPTVEALPVHLGGQDRLEACSVLGLLEDGQHWHRAMAEAAEITFPRQLRCLFALITIEGRASCDIQLLWRNFRTAMSQDVRRRLQRLGRLEHDADLDDDDPMDGGGDDAQHPVFSETLRLIGRQLRRISGLALSDVGLPQPPDAPAQAPEEEDNQPIDHHQRLVDERVPLLTQDQRDVYNEVTRRLATGEGGLLFLQAPGGCGKTFLENVLLASVRAAAGEAIAVATSGIAASLLDGGTTAHSRFKIPISLTDTSTCDLSRRGEAADTIRRCLLLVWDEAGMAHRRAIEAVDRTLRDLRGTDRPFGGLLTLFAGDWQQILPVVKGGARHQVVGACLKASPLWQYVTCLTLRTNMRVQLQGDLEAGEYATFLSQLGSGRLPLCPGTLDSVTVPPTVLSPARSLAELVERIYPDLAQNCQNLEWLEERTILTVLNSDAKIINDHVMESMPGQEKVYDSVDTMTDTNAVPLTAEVLNKIEISGLPPHKIRLKAGAPVLLMRNLDAPRAVNGTLCVVKTLGDNVLELSVLTGPARGESVFVPRIPLESSSDSGLGFSFRRLQFPLSVAFGMTINRSQGQTKKRVGVYLPSPVFTHGQLYVAMSRVGAAAGVEVFVAGTSTRNVVYQEVLE
ncbi:ATP-dependent DNA helicase PIF1 [Amphibalanus amphitrite]|uniref:ATP-dependent DNA helicase n=1 Tax=Amphibalanus amphitrite TaxID=1232801 RepID=A0A6A4VQI1_AMPAM|nr:ATP-dependent DNA helicase PIF1 [Amphibalanus amphitrite]